MKLQVNWSAAAEEFRVGEALEYCRKSENQAGICYFNEREVLTLSTGSGIINFVTKKSKLLSREVEGLAR